MRPVLSLYIAPSIPMKGRSLSCFLVLALAWTLAPLASATVLRVKTGLSVQNPDGLSWTNAFPSVTNAVAVARAGDEIWVAAGVYGGGLTLSNGIALYGGFSGTEASRDLRDFRANVTTLDGGGKSTVIVVESGAGPSTRVDGFTIQAGRASGSGALGSGGGLRAVGADPVVANNQFRANNASRSGTAVYLESSSATLISNYFGFNGPDITTRDGGAVAVAGSSPTIQGNSFVGNRGRDGGAVHFATSTGFLIGNSLLNNSASRDGGAIMCVSASPQITHNRMLGNTAPARGGGVALTAGSATLLFNNVFSRNSAATGTNELGGGGGVFADQTSQPSILNNTLVMNEAPVGGLLLSNRNALVANNIIAFGSSGVGGVDSLKLQTNNIYGNTANFVGVPDVTGTAGNISADPKFAGDYGLGVVNILPDSPCRDAGNSAVIPAAASDLDGEPRIQGPAVDIGADETDGVSTYFLPTVVRVAPDGNDQNLGDDWSRSKRTLQSAIELAGLRGGEVWVKEGTYVGNITIRPFTYIYAGFNGMETNRLERNWATHLTTLDGGGVQSVARFPGLSFDETLDGFAIRNGAATAGGGVYADGNIRIANNHFESNETSSSASSNPGTGGGAIYVSGGGATIVNNTFLRNRATMRSRTVSADGGAIKVAAGMPLVANNLFRMNTATNSLALGEAQGGAVAVVSNAAPRIINNTFLQNSALSLTRSNTLDHGGALSFSGSITNPAAAPLLVNNLVVYNSSGISAKGRVPDLYNNLVYGNFRTNFEFMADPTGTRGNISKSPRLTGPYGDPHLMADSPARDAGDDSVLQAGWLDLDGKARVVGEAPDIGADEFDGTTFDIADRVFYVRPEGQDTNSGITWEAAKQTLGAALAAAAVDGGEVWVAAGTYQERVQVDLFTYLYGGFSGTETNRSARNWFAQPCILDGGASPTRPVAGKPVVTVIGTDGYAAVDGLTVRNGAAVTGGGLNVFGSAFIAHNTISNNVAVSALTNVVAAGAGLYCESGAPNILNNLFVANRCVATAPTNSRGGAIYLASPAGQIATVLNNTLLDNRAADGGAVFLAGSTGARILNNIAAFGTSGFGAANSTNIARYNCVYGNSSNDYSGIIIGTGSIESDPLFVDWRQRNYRLRADSPCINTGDASASAGDWDIFGEPRLVGAAPEIGADEFSGPAAADFELALTQPLAGSVAVAPATVFLSAAVAGGTLTPVYIEYLANGSLVATGTNAPFSAFAQNLIANDYSMVARAVTAGGAMATSAPVGIIVVPPPNNVPPKITFSTPTNGQAFFIPTDVRVAFSWTKPGGRVTRWELFTNDVFAIADPSVASGVTSASVTFTNVATASYKVTVIATDNIGSKGTNEVSYLVRKPDPVASVAQQPQRLPNGSLRLEFSAQSADANYVLESSTDFRQWVPISTNQGGAPIQAVVPVNLQVPIEVFRTRAVYP